VIVHSKIKVAYFCHDSPSCRSKLIRLSYNFEIQII